MDQPLLYEWWLGYIVLDRSEEEKLRDEEKEQHNSAFSFVRVHPKLQLSTTSTR